VREAAAVAGLDDLAVEGEAVDDGGTEARVGDGFGPAGERLFGGDRDGGLLLPVGEDLAWNQRCQPFTWTKDADTILAKPTPPKNRNTNTSSETRH
jgi:hypothetical protein